MTEDSDFTKQLFATVKKDGWDCIRVAGGPPVDEVTHQLLRGSPTWDPPFAYTAGPSRHGDPELILVGEWKDDREILETILIDLIGDRGTKFTVGDETDLIFETFPVRFGAVSVEARESLMTFASLVSDGEPFLALQVLFPDARGVWPGQSAYDGTPQPSLATPGSTVAS